MPPVGGGHSSNFRDIVIPRLGLMDVLDWHSAPAAAISRSGSSALTLGSDTVAAAAIAEPTAAAALSLGSDTVAAAGTMRQFGAAAVSLGSDVVSAISASCVAVAHPTLAGDIWSVQGRPQLYASPSIELVDDVVAAAGHMQTATVASITLGSDTVLAETGINVPLTLADDVVAAVALSTVQGSADILLEGVWHVAVIVTADVADGHAHITLGSDTVAATGAPAGHGSAALTLADDVVRVIGFNVAGLAALTLRDDVITAAGVGRPVPTAHPALILASDVIVANSEAFGLIHGSGGVQLHDDLVAAAGTVAIITSSGAGSLTLRSDTVVAAAATRAATSGSAALTLGNDTVRAFSGAHAATTGSLGITLRDDIVRALGTAAATATAHPALVLHDDIIRARASGHPDTTGSSSGWQLADDQILALATGAAPSSSAATALTLHDDIVAAVSAAHAMPAAAPALILADDIVAAVAFAQKIAYADPYAATETR